MRRGTAALVRFALAGVEPGSHAVGGAVAAARRNGVPRRALEETALMLVLYAGYPAALETLRALNQAWPGRARATRLGRPAAWRERGRRLGRRVYGAQYPRLVAGVRTLHPDLAVWMVEQGYGRVLSRRGLAARERELVTVAVLAGARWERQLVSHLLGAARVGARPTEIRRALEAGARTPATRAIAKAAWRTAFGPPTR